MYEAARVIAHELAGYTVVITKSTVPIGTGDEVERIIRETRPDADFSVVANPEFLREGAAIEDFKHPDRIVIGTTDERARKLMAEVYRPLFLNQAPLLTTSRAAAELTKYAANAFLAMKITFINEIADLCEQVGADVQEIARGIGFDRRIGAKFLHAGPGYGGSCFPKDILALIKTAQDHSAPLRIVETVAAVNEQRKRAMARKVIAACGGSVRGKTIALLGLTFKPNTDDMREAPSIAIIQGLQDAGAHVRAYDPVGMALASTITNNVAFAENAYTCAEGAHALVLVTEWEAFRALDLGRIRDLLKTPIWSTYAMCTVPKKLASKALPIPALEGRQSRGITKLLLGSCRWLIFPHNPSSEALASMATISRRRSYSLPCSLFCKSKRNCLMEVKPRSAVIGRAHAVPEVCVNLYTSKRNRRMSGTVERIRPAIIGPTR